MSLKEVNRARVAQWRGWAGRARAAGARTPFYLFAAGPVAAQVAELERLDVGRPVTQWFSAKTQPLPALLRWWERQGRPVEVVSEFELRLARAAGFAPGRILVNGPAKHRWLAGRRERGLRVNFDSLHELETLLPEAVRWGWDTGLRLHTAGEIDPENPAQSTQFGLRADEAARALERLRSAGLSPRILHFHLRTNLDDPGVLAGALREAAALGRAHGWEPEVLDVGGGLPPPHGFTRGGRPLAKGLSPATYARTLRQGLAEFPGTREIWMEHGRFVCAGSGVLAVGVLDRKDWPEGCQLICDGGRTQHALVSTWERHDLWTLEPRRGRLLPTVVHGPTCMAFDQLGRHGLPGSVGPGDVLLWAEAGAYHLPWETRFSHGLAEVWWVEDDTVRRVRRAESYAGYAGRWEPGRNPPVG